MSSFSWTNEETGRKATLTNNELKLIRVTGNKRKTEKRVWPDIKGTYDDLVNIARSWVVKGKLEL